MKDNQLLYVWESFPACVCVCGWICIQSSRVINVRKYLLSQSAMLADCVCVCVCLPWCETCSSVQADTNFGRSHLAHTHTLPHTKVKGCCRRLRLSACHMVIWISFNKKLTQLIDDAQIWTEAFDLSLRLPQSGRERERDKDTHVSRDLIAIYRMLLIGLYNLMRILNVHIHIFTNLSLFISVLVYFYFWNLVLYFCL